MKKSGGISRRSFLQGSTASFVGVASLTSAKGGIQEILSTKKFPYLKNAKIGKKTVVIGMDGMDPSLLRRFMAEGKMPTFSDLAASGSFGELQTTMPPQSPVAWSSFITGTNPGGHGIFDFVHRDPKAFEPYLSTTRSTGSSRSIPLGKYKIPVSSGSVDLMRKGRPFWSVLEEHGVPCSLFALPANFPVVQDGDVKGLSGMGTPDLLGSYGTFTLISEVDIPGSDQWSGGRVVRVRGANHVFTADLEGPANAFSSGNDSTTLPVRITRDPWEPNIKLTVGEHDLILKQGDWSGWLPLRFEFLPMFASVAGMVRVYVKQVHPTLKIYVSPINVDPMDPSLPIASPGGYAKEVAEVAGRFYTQGFPADQKALAFGVLSDDEYFEQAKIVLNENFRILDYQLSQFDDGFFFFYFSSLDQNCHMMLRLCDPQHPLYKPEASAELKDSIGYFYRRMDEALKLVMSRVGADASLFVLSDHGFGTFEREVHLSRWLVDEGFTVLKDPTAKDPGEMYSNVDWSKTTAYALGINVIYLNVRDREPNGIVDPASAAGVKAKIIERLPQLRDHERSGASVVKAAFDGEQIYHGPFCALAPDVLVGYQRGYRISDEAVLGQVPSEVIGDRTNKWSADHCFDPSLVPGVLLSNQRQLRSGSVGIWDLAPTILHSFGLQPLKEMDGKSILI